MTNNWKRKTKIPRTRNAWTMTEAQFRSYIISTLRKASMYWKPKSQCISEARVKRWVYKCEMCNREWPATLPPLPWKKRKRKNIQADHILPAVDPKKGWESWDSFIERLFVEKEWYQAICRECHSWEDWKTKKENKERKKYKELCQEYIWKSFWKLIIVEIKDLNKVECECECWNIKEIKLSNLKNWHTRSCWCIAWTHKLSWTRIYKIWININSRCNNPNSTGYKYYWWRWIEVEWNTFEDFYNDMKDWYSDDLTIDRIDSNWNYCKENCRWTTYKQQANNKGTQNHKITFEWETKTISEWADSIWIKQNTLLYRIKRWWTIGESLWVDKREVPSRSILKEEYYNDIIELYKTKTQAEIWKIYWVDWSVVSRFLKTAKEKEIAKKYRTSK